jgi:hypothetical protein
MDVFLPERSYIHCETISLWIYCGSPQIVANLTYGSDYCTIDLFQSPKIIEICGDIPGFEISADGTIYLFPYFIITGLDSRMKIRFSVS